MLNSFINFILKIVRGTIDFGFYLVTFLQNLLDKSCSDVALNIKTVNVQSFNFEKNCNYDQNI